MIGFRFKKHFSINHLNLAGYLAGVALIGGVATADAAERRIVTIEDADYFGADYRTVKDVDLEACKAVCLQDNQCRAFTFNTSAGWCFLKSDTGHLQSFAGAVAGRVLEVSAPRETAEAERSKELTFLTASQLQAAKTFEVKLKDSIRPGAVSAESLKQAGSTALSQGDGRAAENAFSELAVLQPSETLAWVGLSRAYAIQSPDNWQERQAKKDNAVHAAISGYLRAITRQERAVGLDVLGQALARQENWKPAIKAYRASLALEDQQATRKRYDEAVAEHGFRIVNHQVDADTVSPRICLVFSENLPRGADLSPYIKATGAGTLSVETSDSQICIDGVQHGARYSMTARSGLPSADGEKLEKQARLSIYVRDREPSVRFIGRAYVLPSGGEPTIPIISVNTTEVETSIYRIGDRGVADAVRDGNFLKQLADYQASQIEEKLGEAVWSGTVKTGSDLNRDVTTAIPLSEIGLDIKPGVYVMTARSRADTKNRWGPLATQWFLVSDLGLSALSADDGITATVRSLNSAKALESIPVRLVAVNNEILAETTTDNQGVAQFSAGLTRGIGGRAPALLVAETEEGDYAFLDLRKPAFDLSDRGVEGRPAPGPLDVFAWTDRGIYKAGGTVHVQALLRTQRASAQSGLPLTLRVSRPDGVEHLKTVLQDRGLGGYLHDLSLSPTAQQGLWSYEILADPSAPALARKDFLVEDYQPERVDYSLKTKATAFRTDAPTPISVDAEFLYGAPASGQKLQGTISVKPTRSLPDYPGYQFGMIDDQVFPIGSSLPAGLVTDADGKLEFGLSLPNVPETTGLYKAEVTSRLVEAGGRYVERLLDMLVVSRGARIGIKPDFEDGVDEGGPAAFSVIVVGTDGQTQDQQGLNWSLYKLDRQYQWYMTDGRWKFEPITSTRRVADGELGANAAKPEQLSVPVEWGEYRLEIASEQLGAVTSVEFSAGWYTVSATSDTPDYLDVGLDKETYTPGETAKLRIVPQMPGEVTVQVISGGVQNTQIVTVGSDPVEVPIEVTSDWGAGAYVTANLARPMDLEASRMPSRAIGLSWLKVDPGDRVLNVNLDLPERILPETELAVPIEIANLASGEEAYVTVAAVDVGILNLTRFETPAPDKWYFGQHRLGADMRDLYGQLIDRTLGTRGRVRSGGDGGAMRLDAPPPDEEPVALFSGVVEVGADGKALVSFQIPDFNGRLKLIAVAWSKDGVGHAEQEVEVRTPVVVTATAPQFLSPEDTSRLVFAIDNVDGAAGRYTLSVSSDSGVSFPSPDFANRTLELETGKRVDIRLPIAAGRTLGRSEIVARLNGPNGEQFSERVTIDVKDTQPNVVRRSQLQLAANGSLTLDAAVLDGLRPQTTHVSVTAGLSGRIDVGGLLTALDRYPYGCTEQTTSQVMPLLYLSSIAENAGLGSAGDLKDKIEVGIQRILANQSASGSFGLWNSYSTGDGWLDAYVTDALTRAKEQGFAVPDRALQSALDNLENRLAYTSDFTKGGEDIGYALYVLARNGRATIGDLRYYLDAKLNAFSTPLAKAQVAAGLALYGEQERATIGFDAAVSALQTDGNTGYRSDYGSPLRDDAGVVSYIAGTLNDAPLVNRAVSVLETRQENTGSYSTQDMAWLLLAAKELQNEAATAALSVNGQSANGRIAWSFDGADLSANPVQFENGSTDGLDLLVSVSGQPHVPEPAGGKDYTIERALYNLDGNKIEGNLLPLNKRIAVVVTVRALSEQAGRLMVVDRVPAGFAIDNPRLVRSGDVGGLSFFDTIDRPQHIAFHPDRVEAAIDQKQTSGKTLTFAYLARTVVPGTYSHPPATVEDMYRRERRANTDTKRIEIVGPDR